MTKLDNNARFPSPILNESDFDFCTISHVSFISCEIDAFRVICFGLQECNEVDKITGEISGRKNESCFSVRHGESSEPAWSGALRYSSDIVNKSGGATL